MKIDRLLGIVIYLMNREKVTASYLAEKFEVSSRTIQRDMDTLSMAGIPIVSIQGTKGGYEIIDGFQLDKQLETVEDYNFIKTALSGLCTAYSNDKLQDTMYKIRNSKRFKICENETIKFDFSVSREGKNIDEFLEKIQSAIIGKKRVKYLYTNSYGETKERMVEPIGAIYKWYGWYILAYSIEKKDYRLFKVARMRDLEIDDDSFSIEHESFQKILKEYEENDQNNYLHVKAIFNGSIRVSIEEYFPKGKIREIGNHKFTLEFTAPENERGWKGLLYTYGGDISIVEPESLREEFITKAQGIINNNKK